MPMWELREDVCGEDREMEQESQDGGDPPQKRLLGLYSTPELARAALATRLRPLFGGGDCFTTPCHDALQMVQRWNADGSGQVVVFFKKPAKVEGAYTPYVYYEELTLSVELVQTKVDEPPPDDRYEDWQQFLEAVRPPPTAEELAAKAVRNMQLSAAELQAQKATLPWM